MEWGFTFNQNPNQGKSSHKIILAVTGIEPGAVGL